MRGFLQSQVSPGQAGYQGCLATNHLRDLRFSTEKKVVRAVRIKGLKLFRETSWLQRKNICKAIAPPRLRAKRGEDLGVILQ